MLMVPERHEPLAGAAWSEVAARSAIIDIAADACAKFDRTTLWPRHPRDTEPHAPGLPVASLYDGAAGVVWALQRLHGAGLAPISVEVDACVDGLFQRSQQYNAAANEDARSYLAGATGVLLLQWRQQRSPGVADALIALVRSNLDNPLHEPLWGSPGTMVAAIHMLEATGEARWLALFREAADAVFAGMHRAPGLDDTWVWTQAMFGRDWQHLGAGHGFAGNLFPFVRGAQWLAPEVVEAAETRALQTLGVSAVREAGAVNWEPVFDPAAHGLPSRLMMQDCHGAPGIVCRLAGCRSPALRALLVEAAEAVWRAGPLVKGPGLCHGTAGNGYALLKAHAMTGDALWLVRARAFAMHALLQTEAQRREHGQRRYALWTGDFGVALLLAGCITGDASFPTLDVF